MRRFIAVTGVEKEPVWACSENCWHELRLFLVSKATASPQIEFMGDMLPMIVESLQHVVRRLMQLPLAP